MAPAPTSAPSPDLLLSLQGAGVRLAAKQALQPLSIDLHRGERLALVGANGSGKTTLLRLMHGLVPHSGQRRLHPLQPENRAPVLAMLFQRPFLMSLSVHKNLALALWLRGVPRAERPDRVAQALARVGLAAQADQAARTLSGGQQQRLALARAWALRPDVLLLDEPTASLDPSAKREVEDLIEDFAGQGMTVVLTTHNLGQAKRLASRVAYLEAGQLVVDLPVDRFFTEQLPSAAAQFLKGELPWT